MNKAVFIDRDGVINREVNYLHRIDDFVLLPGTAEAVRLLNRSAYLAIVITNQSVVARNLCSVEELERIHEKMASLLNKKNACLDAVYYCPHYPDKDLPRANPRYLLECECRKPKPGMINAAAKDFNINPGESFMIGDSERDILCGRNAGLSTICVKTGNACSDGDTRPDYFFDTLYDAVDFIVNKFG